MSEQGKIKRALISVSDKTGLIELATELDKMGIEIISTGGTGLTQRDSTPEALRPLFDRDVEGFGELFRQLSYEEIGTSTVQSRAIAGLANETLVFCLPGSSGACRTGWERILKQQLDSRTRPCNFAQMFRA